MNVLLSLKIHNISLYSKVILKGLFQYTTLLSDTITIVLKTQNKRINNICGYEILEIIRPF